MSVPKKPPGFEHDLGDYGPQFYDSNCGEPIAWGFKIVRFLDDQRFKDLGNYGFVECGAPGSWFLITEKLTRADAIKKYGKVTAEEFGPRGGFRSVTFGKKKFISSRLAGGYG